MEGIRDKRILLVDDDEHMVRALNKTFTSEGAIVTNAHWAADAVEFLIKREKHIDLVITDLRMPFVTGMTLVYAIRLMFPTLPVVVLTAYASPEVRAECFRQGAAAFLEKTVDTAQLLAEIEKVLKVDPGNLPRAEIESADDETMLLDRIIHAHGQ